MGNDGNAATGRTIKICSFLACGCRRVCSCKEDTAPVDTRDDRSKQHSHDADNWPSNPKPWMPSWFDPADKAREHSAVGAGKVVALYTGQSAFPTQARRTHHVPATVPINPAVSPSFGIVGHPSLKIYRFRLPPHLHNSLDQIVEGCHDHVAKLPSGWMTYLYSLTKQDVALRDVPGMYEASKPIIHYIKKCMEQAYKVSTVRIDRNQPHVLKYSAEDASKHTGVELHHDKCDFTANVMMSRSDAYVGGGTYFPDANCTVRLEFGEFLIHPGNLVHGGVDISRGTRYLMILFTHTE